ncbi:MAG TPA: DNA methyltransferase [Ktedonobacteraceae bacterium]|jgi:DNA modification methylase
MNRVTAKKPGENDEREVPAHHGKHGLLHPCLYLLPNPHFGDFVAPDQPVKRVEEPYAQSVAAGKNTYVYDAHTYHTKVPPQGIEGMIEYYTRPGDVVLDPFCGSGMTGVAATQKGRKALLSDLSPAATFIAYNLNTPIDAHRYLHAVSVMLAQAQDLEHVLYDTQCRTCGKKVPILYMVWSYGMLCKHCHKEFILWDVARDERPRARDSKIKSEFDCPSCGVHLKKRELKKTRRYPVQIGYKCCQRGLKETTCVPDKDDRATLERIDHAGIPSDLWYPTAPFPAGINTKQPVDAGITSIDKVYTTRALRAMAYLWDLACRWPDEDIKQKLLFTLTSLYQRVTVFCEFRFWGGSSNTANFHVPAIMNEQNVFRTFERKAKTINLYFNSVSTQIRPVSVSTQPASHLPQIPDHSIDYIFTDPPFGANINYSEMNFLWEGWLGVFTNTREETIVNKIQKKGMQEYENLLRDAFLEMRRVLKTDGWLTIIFHNSSKLVWNALQQAMNEAGFAIQGTQTFDKEHGTCKQFVSENAVGYDLVLQCQKAEQSQTGTSAQPAISEQETSAFIRSAVAQAPDQYIVHYLHVSRKNEFDYRRLYANWLATAVQQTFVSLSFEDFRRLAQQILKDEGLMSAAVPTNIDLLQRSMGRRIHLKS